MWKHVIRSRSRTRQDLSDFAWASGLWRHRLPLLKQGLVLLVTLAACIAPASTWGQDSAENTVLAAWPSSAADAAPADALMPEPTGRPVTSRFSAVAIINTMRQGGVMFLPLAVCSFLLFVFAFERAISLRRGRVIPRPFVRRFVHQIQEGELDRREALARCREDRSPVAEVFAAGVIKWDRPSVEVEQAILDGGERVANSLRRYLRLFNGIATISPLLGLLGTVLGMIRAFNAIATADAMGKPELLANGISQALLTTAAGLTVAIPAYVAHLFFSSRVDRLVMDIDHLGQKVVNGVACDGFKEKPARKKRARAA